MPLIAEYRRGGVRLVGRVRPVKEDRVPHRREAMDAYMLLANRAHDQDAAAALDCLWRAITHYIPE